MNQSKDYDVVIIGGGPAGCAAAVRLNQLTNLRVLLIDRSDSRAYRVGESIPPDSQNLLKLLGLWQAFQSQHHEPCLGSCSTWGSDSLGYNDFIYNPMGHGWHLDRNQFNLMLQKAVKDSEVEFSSSSQFISSQLIEKGHLLTIKKNNKKHHINTQWVIDASGIKASFASKLGAKSIYQDHQVCLTGFFNQGQGTTLNQLTLIEATSYGWWYTARLPNKKTVVALTCDRDFMKYFKLRNKINWFKLLMAHSHYIAPQLTNQNWLEGSFTIHRTPSCINSQITGNHWLVTGDAAAAYDPISAQGIYKALYQGINAAETIQQHRMGNHTSLQKYSQSIKQQYAIYLDQRNHLYQQEKRWQHSPFWQQRQKPTWAKIA